MTTLTLFGLALAPLYAAIAKVESDDGMTSSNIYQIDVVGHGYIDDVNRILEIYNKTGLSFPYFSSDDKYSREESEKMMLVYWEYWGGIYQRKTGRPVTYEILARIHNGGPVGWRMRSTVGYWEKVSKILEVK